VVATLPIAKASPSSKSWWRSASSPSSSRSPFLRSTSRTDWISERGRARLQGYGIAPPAGKAGKRALFGGEPQVACPQCGSPRTEMISEFGSTPCKALWRCMECREPFDYFKCI
jgi:phenylacetate-CoA oxygenase PaaJ subunit